MVDTNDKTILSSSGSHSASPDYLFVYGTLLPSFDNVFALYLRQHSRFLEDGYFPGLLLDLGHYPGALYQPDSGGQVAGSIYKVDLHKQQLLSYLDDYEGVGERHPQPHEYIRTVVPVSSRQGVIQCWTYLYNLPVHNQTRVESGNYEQYLKHRI